MLIVHDLQQVLIDCPPLQTEAEIMCLVANSNEFENIKVRDDEIPELEDLMHDAWLIGLLMSCCLGLCAFMQHAAPSERWRREFVRQSQHPPAGLL